LFAPKPPENYPLELRIATPVLKLLDAALAYPSKGFLGALIPKGILGCLPNKLASQIGT
jgi:hypothetical protein